MKQTQSLWMYVLPAFLLMIGAACTKSSSDNTDQMLMDKLWYFESITTNASGTLTHISYKHAEGCAKDYREFRSGGRMNDVTYNAQRNCAATTVGGSWSRHGSVITFTEDGIANRGDIITLTDSELVVRATLLGVMIEKRFVSY